jgi:hypothetical protein
LLFSFQLLYQTNIIFTSGNTCGHLFPLHDFESVLDLIAFCNMVIFLNILDFQTYQYKDGTDINDTKTLTDEHLVSIEAFDFNMLSAIERRRYQHARGLAYRILDWLFKSVDIKDNTGEIVEDAYSTLWAPYIAQQASAILQYKIEAENAELWGAPGCTVKTLKRQILLCFKGSELEELVNSAIQAKHSSLAFPNPENYTATKRDLLSAPLGMFFLLLYIWIIITCDK